MPISYSFANAQRLVIKPFDRLGFISLYLLATVISSLAIRLVIAQSPFVHLWQHSPMQYSIIAGLVSGTFLGATEWLILRRYFPDWKWILVVAVGSTLSNTLQFAFDNRLNQLLFGVVDDLSGQTNTAVVEITAIYMALLGTGVISGFLQWYVLQAYVAAARWWILIPLMTALVGMVPWLIGIVTQQYISLPFAILLNVVYLYPMVQALGFCCLHKKSEQNILCSDLASAPDISSFLKTRNLEKKLYGRINQIWKTDLSSSIGQLSYFVGVNPNASSIIYEPMNPTSAENIDLTPLSNIATHLDEADVQLDGDPFAKFQLIFSPPGVVQMRAWRGIPLVWIGIGVYIAGVAIQYYMPRILSWLELI